MVTGLLQRQGCELLDESPLGLSGSVLKWIAWQLLHALKALHEEQVRRPTQSVDTVHPGACLLFCVALSQHTHGRTRTAKPSADSFSGSCTIQVCHGQVCPASISVQIATAQGGSVGCPAVFELRARSAAAAGSCSPLEQGGSGPAESYCRAPEQLLGQQGVGRRQVRELLAKKRTGLRQAEGCGSC